MNDMKINIDSCLVAYISLIKFVLSNSYKICCIQYLNLTKIVVTYLFILIPYKELIVVIYVIIFNYDIINIRSY